MLYIPNQNYDAVRSVAPVLIADPNGDVRIGPNGRYRQIGESEKVHDGYIPRINGFQVNKWNQISKDSIFNIVKTQDEVCQRIAATLAKIAETP